MNTKLIQRIIEAKDQPTVNYSNFRCDDYEEAQQIETPEFQSFLKSIGIIATRESAWDFNIKSVVETEEERSERLEYLAQNDMAALAWALGA